MSSDEELTKYEPFSKKKMLAFALYMPILNTFWTLRNWAQIYAAKALGIPIILILCLFLYSDSLSGCFFIPLAFFFHS